MYRLCYVSDGASVSIDIVSPTPEPDVFVDLKFKCVKHLKFAEDPGPRHRTGADAYITAAILHRAFFAGATLEQMMEASNRPALLPRLGFGKHAKTPIAEVPVGYLNWITRQADMDENVRHTVAVELQRRMAMLEM